MKKTNLWTAFAILLIFCTGSAFAGPITYTESATGSGMLGNSSFTDALITLSFTGNTANVTCDTGLCINDAGPGVVSLTVAGLGTATFLDDVLVFDNQGVAVAGFLDATVALDILDTHNPAFATYDLTTAIGPLTGSSIINSGTDFFTTDGTFVINSAGDATFTATTSAPIPEPSTLVLFGTSMLGLAGIVRRKLHS